MFVFGSLGKRDTQKLQALDKLCHKQRFNFLLEVRRTLPIKQRVTRGRYLVVLQSSGVERPPEEELGYHTAQ